MGRQRPQEMPEQLEPVSYAAWFRSELGRRVWRDERRALDRPLEEVTGRSVLDVGAGEGRLARELSARGAQVVALDRSEAMLRAAGGGEEHPLERVRGDALLPPFVDHAFDIVVAVTVLCFTTRPRDMTRELARVTKPGGRVVLGELGRWSTWALARRIRGWLKGGLWAHTRLRTASELRGILTAAELDPGPVYGAVYYPRSVVAARLLGGADPWLGGMTSLGAAFLAVAGVKDPGERDPRRRPIGERT